MSGSRDHLDRAVQAANPVSETPTATAGLDERARIDLAHILASALGEPARRGRRPMVRRPLLRWAVPAVVGAVALLAAAVVGVEIRRGGRSAMAATPALLVYRPLADGRAAPTILRELAARVQALPDDTGTGRYARLEQRSWSLWTTVDGEDTTSEVVPQQSTLWVADDGSGRWVRTLVRSDGETGVEDRDLAPGDYVQNWPLRSLPDDDVAFDDALAIGHPRSNGPGGRMAALGDLARSMPLSPAVRAAALRYLAATDGVGVSGWVTDRAGRDGIAFHVDSAYGGLPARYTIIVDPAGGQMLADEELLTTTAGKLNVRIPSVIDYTLYLSAGYTDSVR